LYPIPDPIIIQIVTGAMLGIALALPDNDDGEYDDNEEEQ
jgi:hypothetical protein